MKKISIIIPCFNAGALVEEAVASALAQRGTVVEVVVIDDGSTDPATLDALQRISVMPQVTCIRQNNAGPAAARNRAIQASKGDFILPLDADDRFSPEYAAAALKAMESDHRLGIVYCRASKFGAEQGTWRLPEYSRQEMAVDNVIFCSAMFRRADWASVGGYNEALRHGMEDYDFWLRILGLGREVVQLPVSYFHYRVQATSRTTRFMAEQSKVVATYAAIFRDHRDFFAMHADAMYAFRFRQQRELEHFRHRYGRIDAIIDKLVWLRPIGRSLNRFLAWWVRR